MRHLGLLNMEARLRHFLDLKDDWDSYGAPPISLQAVEAVATIDVAPTNRGGVNVSWCDEQVQIEFSASGDVVSVCWDRT